MYKHKLFSRHPRHLLKSKGSFKTYTKSHHKAGSGIHNSMDNYLLSLVNGVRHNIKISKNQHSKRSTPQKHHNSSGGALKFIR